MEDLIEVLFENIPQTNVVPMLHEILSLSSFYECVNCPPEMDKSMFSSFSTLEDILINLDDFITIYTLKDIKTENQSIDHIVLRLIKFQNYFDIDFSFSEKIDTDENRKLLKDIFNLSNQLRHKYFVFHCYAGMEPAIDEATRYFTDDKIGPLLEDWKA